MRFLLRSFLFLLHIILIMRFAPFLPLPIDGNAAAWAMGQSPDLCPCCRASHRETVHIARSDPAALLHSRISLHKFRPKKEPASLDIPCNGPPLFVHSLHTARRILIQTYCPPPPCLLYDYVTPFPPSSFSQHTGCNNTS